MLSYLFLLRIPLGIGLLMGLFKSLALSGGLSPYLAGFYDLDAPSSRWVAMAAATLAMACTLVTDMVLRYASTRLGAPALPAWCQARVAPQWTAFLGIGLMRITALAAVAYSFAAIRLASGLSDTMAVWQGFGLFLLIFFVLAWLFRHAGNALPFSRDRPLVVIVMRWLRSPEGFLDAQGQPVPGHRLSQNALAIFALVYLAFGWKGWSIIEGRHGEGPTTFLCVLFLLTLACWLLSGLSFIFDRWRFPVLALLGLLWATGSGVLGGDWFRRTDHVFETTIGATPFQAPMPADLLRPRRDRVVLVAASGGGIFSAGWVTQVLGGLSADDAEFAPSVRLVSSVSGGSVGAMYWLDAFENGNFNAARDAVPVFNRATRSSLSQVAWGLSYPDLLRLFFPFTPQTIDRAWALEQAWVRDHEQLSNATLRRWAEQPQARPALAFNSTVIEAGQRFVFATWRAEAPGARSFWQEFPRQDLPIARAARLSAAFPWVSPVARNANPGDAKHAYHLGDGGYFDNFGIVTALDFLRSALDGTKQAPRVLLIQIELGPLASGSPSFQPRGWGYQLLAPADGFLAVWNQSARYRNQTDVGLVQQLYANHIEAVRFGFPDSNTPTSWHLTAPQIASLRDAWANDPGIAAARRQVKAFLTAP